ncbi:DNA repair protein RecN [Candidatus Neomarinimicrobiota bacterium]
MLTRLYIKNLAIIAESEIEFASGLNIITGETGAGKSILINALSLVLGGRASAELIRTGEDTAIIEGYFSTESGPLVIRRVLRSNGASRIFVNDEPMKLTELAEATAGVVDLHGQHDHQSLLHVRTHLEYLDAFGGLVTHKSNLAAVYAELKKAESELAKTMAMLTRNRELHELHQFQLNELQAAQGDLEIESALQKEHQLLSQAEALKRVLTSLEQSLTGESPGVNATIAGLQRQLEQFTYLGSELTSLAERIAAAKIELDDVAFDLSRYSSTISPDRERLAELDERLAQVETMKRKYGGSAISALEHLGQLEKEVDDFGNAGQNVTALKSRCQELTARYSQLCTELSAERTDAAGRLSQEIVGTLAELHMPAALFDVRINHTAHLEGECIINGERFQCDETGYDQVEFYISANPGEELRPLARIASGGEISRTMLGIKQALVKGDPVATLVFDEIDSGISGSTADVVGKALRKLSKTKQIICITHLAQIAAQGNHHIQVSKSHTGARTISLANPLDNDSRRREIARLLSGTDISPASLIQADNLLTVSTN